jgi:hypothetical protein
MSYKTLGKSDAANILSKTAAVAAGGKFEPFKTTATFDATARHPAMLGYKPQI